MDCEAECLAVRLSGLREERLYGRRAFSGRLGGADGEEVFAVVSGVGKVNAAAAAQAALAHTGVKTIYNIGVAGGLEPDMRPGDMFEVSRAVQYDFDLSQLTGKGPGVLDGRDSPFFECRVSGFRPAKILGSGDRFNDDPGDNRLLRSLGAGLRDMEGAAIAQVCETAGAEFASLKCVSDVYGSGVTTEQFKENLARCLKLLAAAPWPL